MQTENDTLKPEDELKQESCGASMSGGLFAVGDWVVVTKDGAMTEGKECIIERWENGKWKVKFSPQWCGYYLPSEISHANDDAMPSASGDTTTTSTTD